jgi:hypothetical protein
MAVSLIDDELCSLYRFLQGLDKLINILFTGEHVTGNSISVDTGKGFDNDILIFEFMGNLRIFDLVQGKTNDAATKHIYFRTNDVEPL